MDENLRSRKTATFKQELVSFAMVNWLNLVLPLRFRNKHYALVYCKTHEKDTYIVKEKKPTSEL